MLDPKNPFQTFQKSAFRLEGLPQYLVEEECVAFQEFKDTGSVRGGISSEWAQLVAKNVNAGKEMHRLRLLSRHLTAYEQFEASIYTGPAAGEVIHANYRELFQDRYKGDFWLFDDEWIAWMAYDNEGVFKSFDIRKASQDEIKECQYWRSIFNTSLTLNDFLTPLPPHSN